MLRKLFSALWIKCSEVSHLHMHTLTMFWLPVLHKQNNLNTSALSLIAHRLYIVINPSKCIFGVKELNFLGHYIDHQGITQLQTKVQTISEFPQLKTQPQLCRFSGLVNFYHWFIPHCAEMLYPLHCLLTSKAKPQELSWNEYAIKAFQTVKQPPAHATLLVHPKSPMLQHPWWLMHLTLQLELSCNNTQTACGV